MTAVPLNEAPLADVEALLAAFAADLHARGLRADPKVVRAARSLCQRFGGAEAFAAASVDAQLAATSRCAPFIDWLLATGPIALSADHLMRRKPRMGHVFARFHPGWHQRFSQTAADLGFAGQTIGRQWVALAQICAVTGAAPDRIDYERLSDGHQQLVEAARRHWAPGAEHTLRSAFFSLEVTLFHADVTDRTTTKRRNTAPRHATSSGRGSPRR